MSQSPTIPVSTDLTFLECIEHENSNPAVRFMFSHLKRGGCELSPSKVECKRCVGQLAGGFQDDGGILLCSNHLTTQAHTSNTLIHETVHAFDACRAKVDWSNCVHHACSEIRAAALSGDCNFTREVFLRRNFGFGKQFQRCVKRRAELSVSLNPYCDALAVRVCICTLYFVQRALPAMKSCTPLVLYWTCCEDNTVHIF